MLHYWRTRAVKAVLPLARPLLSSSALIRRPMTMLSTPASSSKAAVPKKSMKAKPRAAKASGAVGANKAPLIAAVVLAGAGGGLGYLFYDPVKSPKELLDGYIAEVMTRFREAADPDIGFLQNSLPPAP